MELMVFCFTARARCKTFWRCWEANAWAALQGRVLMVAIGPTTANALSGAGIQRIARAADTTTKAVVEALEGHLARTKKRSFGGAKEA